LKVHISSNSFLLFRPQAVSWWIPGYSFIHCIHMAPLQGGLHRSACNPSAAE